MIYCKQINQLVALAVLVFSTTSLVNAEEYLVKSPEAYKQTVKKLVAGDTIKLANGVWRATDRILIKFCVLRHPPDSV